MVFIFFSQKALPNHSHTISTMAESNNTIIQDQMQNVSNTIRRLFQMIGNLSRERNALRAENQRLNQQNRQLTRNVQQMSIRLAHQTQNDEDIDYDRDTGSEG